MCQKHALREPLPDHPRERDLAFVDFLLREVGADVAFTPEFAAGAMMGYTMREHVDECHPEEDRETVLAQALEHVKEELRAGYAVGYRWQPKETN